MNVANFFALALPPLLLSAAQFRPLACAAQESPNAGGATGKADPEQNETFRVNSLNDGLSAIHELSRGPATPFARVQEIGQQLLQRFPGPSEQAQIHYRLECVFAAGGIDQQKRTVEHAAEALKGLQSPFERVQAYIFWGQAAAGARIPNGTARKKAGAIYAKALAELAKQKLPEVAPTWPSVVRIDIGGTPRDPEYRAAEQQHEREVAAAMRAKEIADLIFERDALYEIVAELYKTAPRGELQLSVNSEIHDKAVAAATVGRIESAMRAK